MFNTLLIGESKTGKTASLETLPYGTVHFSFDRNGWHSLTDFPLIAAKGEWAPPSTEKHGRRRKRVKVVKSFREWLASDDKLEADCILSVTYEVSDLIAVNQYTRVDAKLITDFINDHNALWEVEKCKEKGIRHTSIDSLTGMQRPVLEFVMAVSGRVTTSIGDYGFAIAKIGEIIDSAVSLPFDFVFMTHIQSEKDEITGRVKEEPLVYGKNLPTTLLSKFDDIFISMSEGSPDGRKYLWGTVPEGLLKSIGSRTFDVNSLPMRIEPNFGKLYKGRFFGEEEVRKDEK